MTFVTRDTVTDITLMEEHRNLSEKKRRFRKTYAVGPTARLARGEEK